MTTPNEMPPGPEKDDCIKLAEMTQSDFASRRDLEWKLSLGLWGSVAAFTYTAVEHADVHARIAEQLTPWIGVPIFAAIVIFHGYVINLVQQSHSKDKLLYWWYRERAEGSNRDRPWKVDETPKSREKKDRATKGDKEDFRKKEERKSRTKWFLYHIGITIIVLAGAFFLLAKVR